MQAIILHVASLFQTAHNVATIWHCYQMMAQTKVPQVIPMTCYQCSQTLPLESYQHTCKHCCSTGQALLSIFTTICLYNWMRMPSRPAVLQSYSCVTCTLSLGHHCHRCKYLNLQVKSKSRCQLNNNATLSYNVLVKYSQRHLSTRCKLTIPNHVSQLSLIQKN